MLKDAVRIVAGGVVRRWRENGAWRRSRAKYPQVDFRRLSSSFGECQFGPGVRVWSGTEIHDSSVGRYTYFASHSYISKSRIGAFCSIGPYVHIGFGRHPTREYVSTYPSFYSPQSAGRAEFEVVTDFEEFLPVTIGNDVLISARCLILDGVTIGDGVIIGAGAVVVADVPPYSVAGGVPARVIRKRFSDDQIAFLQKLAWWDRDFEWIKTHAPLFRDIQSLMKTVTEEEKW
jgi:acetyltransferase-like isoleucine patch superfamily enzyme